MEDALHAIMMSSPCLAGTVAPCARAVGRPLLEGIVTVAKRMVDGFESFTATLPHAIREQTRLELEAGCRAKPNGSAMIRRFPLDRMQAMAKVVKLITPAGAAAGLKWRHTSTRARPMAHPGLL